MTDLENAICGAFERLHDSGRLGLLVDEVIAARVNAAPSRGQIAAMLLAGMEANTELDMTPEKRAEWAVKGADALLAELAKPTEAK